MLHTFEEFSTILIVEDKPENIYIITSHLEKFNYKLVIAHSGEEALERVKTILPDLILLDIMMPGIDGYETCRQFKKKENTRDIPVIFMTALTETEEKIKAFNAGGIDYITKPYHYEELIIRVNSHLALRKMQRDFVITCKLEATGLLAGGLAHDFNNLLSIILGNLELTEMGLGSASMLQKNIDNAKKATLRAKDLTHRLLTFSQGGISEKKSKYINQIVEESARLSFIGSNVTWNLTGDDKFIPVTVDEALMKHVFVSIFTNAIEAMKDGGNVEVTIENKKIFSNKDINTPKLENGDYVFVSIKDQGPGIKPEHINKVQDPYFSTKQRGNDKGMGLGLSIAFSVIRSHNGFIELQSRPGVGTNVNIWLPKASTTPEAIKLTSNKGVFDESDSKLVKILIMDDEEMLLDLLSNLLQVIGFQAVQSKEGREAISLYKEALEVGHGFDAVIMDLTVPGGLGGKDALLKLLRIDPKIKAIVSSGYSNDPVISDYQKWGFKASLIKPYGLKTLRKTLYRVLAEK